MEDVRREGEEVAHDQDYEDLGPNARDGMIEAVKAATHGGAFPTILISVGPPFEEGHSHRVDVAWQEGYDLDAIIDLLHAAIEAVKGEAN